MDVAIWVAIIAAAASIIGILIQKFVKDRSAPEKSGAEAALNRVRGEITKPTPNQSTGRTIRCSGWARNIAAGHHHLWLAVEAGGFIWFKEDEIFVDGNNAWESTLFEDGRTEEFALSLYVANADAHQQILDWFQTGISTGEYPELQRLVGTRRIARVDRLRP